TTNRSTAINVTGSGKLAGSGTIAGSLNIDDGPALSWNSGRSFSVLRDVTVGYVGNASLAVGGGSRINSSDVYIGRNRDAQGT
ncbi:Hypothetical protein, partial CDS, partial [Neorhizobium galegae bv. officinalis]